MISKPTFLKFTGALLIFAVFVQLIIILYNHFSGYLALDGFNEFLGRWIVGSALSLLALPFFTRPDMYLVKRLNEAMPWKSYGIKRILPEFLATILIAAAGATGITLFSHLLAPYRDGLSYVLPVNIMIGSVINLILIIFLEAWHWYWTKEQIEKEKHSLESELKLMRFEILKQQINPHFMFNSLNVLSGLVRKNADLAEQFIDAFADVYRYVMETIERPEVTLNEEMQFARSYFFLQQIRHGDGVDWKVDLPVEYMNHLLPPLSLQLLLENAIKHNAFSPEKPLLVSLTFSDNCLVVSNRLNKKSQTVRSSGTGLQNLKKRYSYLTDKIPTFAISGDFYMARLPLIGQNT